MAEHGNFYVIKFSGLPTGHHQYTFDLTDKFFENREQTIIRKADVTANVVLHKNAGAIQLDMRLEGTVWVECVRCLDEFPLAIATEKTLLVRQVENPSAADDDDDAIHIAQSATEINMDQHLFDFLSLQVPFHPVHPEREDGEPGCNPEALRHLINPGNTSGDDRWDALKKIKLN